VPKSFIRLGPGDGLILQSQIKGQSYNSRLWITAVPALVTFMPTYNTNWQHCQIGGQKMLKASLEY